MSQENRNQQPTHSPAIAITAITPVFLLLFAAIFHPLCSAPLPPSTPIPPSVPSSPYNKSNDFGWHRISRRLRRRRGYYAFSHALESVIPSINVDLVTVFAPRQFRNNSWILHSLEEVVRYHMVFGRYDFSRLVGLASASNETLLMSLVCGRSVKLTSNLSVAPDIRVNDIEIVNPDLIVSKNVVVHGISRKLVIPPPPNGRRSGAHRTNVHSTIG